MVEVSNTKDARSYVARMTNRNGIREVVVLPQYWKPGYTLGHKSTPAEAIRYLYDTMVKMSARSAADAKLAILALEDLRKEEGSP